MTVMLSDGKLLLCWFTVLFFCLYQTYWWMHVLRSLSM